MLLKNKTFCAGKFLTEIWSYDLEIKILGKTSLQKLWKMPHFPEDSDKMVRKMTVGWGKVSPDGTALTFVLMDVKSPHFSGPASSASWRTIPLGAHGEAGAAHLSATPCPFPPHLQMAPSPDSHALTHPRRPFLKRRVVICMKMEGVTAYLLTVSAARVKKWNDFTGKMSSIF